jgi:hypothetical protein
MSDTDKTLKVLLLLQAEVAQGKAQVTGALKEIEAQAAQTAAAVRSVKITDSSVLPEGFDRGDSAKAVALRAELDARVAAKRAAQEAAAVDQAASAAAVAAAEERTIAQARIDAQMERRVIVETQIEAAEARLAGNTTLAVKLEREAEIRARSLGIQRTLNVTTEESIILAERLVLAQEASAVAANGMGINLGKARAEAMVLGRELAAGNVRASTMSSLLGSMGTTFTLIGIGAYELYHSIANEVEETKKLNAEFKKIQGEIGKVGKEWETAASRAQTFSDTVKLADKVKQDLDKMSADMAAFRAKELGFWHRFWDDIVTHNDNAFDVNGVLGKPNQGGVGPFESERRKKALDETNRQLIEANKQLDLAEQSTKDWDAAELDLTRGLGVYTEKLNQAQVKLDQLNAARKANPTDPNAIQAYTEQLSYVDDLKSKTNQLGDELDKNNKKVNTHKETQREINTLVREQANLLAGIRGNQQIIQSNPFLSDAQKDRALIPLITQEIAALNAQIARDKSVLKNSALDPAQYEQVAGKIQQAGVQVTLLSQKLQTLTFTGTIRAGLTQWANQFISAGKQVVTFITTTLNTAIASTSQALTSLIFKTGNWKQAFAQAAQSIVQNLIEILLQWIVSQTIMKALSVAFRSGEADSTASAGASAAAAWAPAATAASIATEGEADLSGVAALAAAMVAGVAIVAGTSYAGGAASGRGAKEGWYVDRGTTPTADDVPVRVSRGEGIINAREVARRGGRSWVDSINSGVTRQNFASGGMISGGTATAGILRGGEQPIIQIFTFTDEKRLRKAIMDSNAGRKIIIDTINGRRVDLGLPS